MSFRVVACVGGDHRVRIEERDIRDPGPGEIALELRLAGFCGTDLFKLETGATTEGMVLGHEIVGDVAAIGEGSAEQVPFELGDRVVVPHHVACGDCAYCRKGSETMCRVFRDNLLDPGGFAERLIVKSRATALAARKVPEGIADDAAVFMEPASCVLRGLHRAGIVDDKTTTIAIQGAGSMGLLHVLVVRALYPDTCVIAVDPVDERQRIAVELGANAACAPDATAFDLVSEHSDGLGADAVFDTVGGAALVRSALELCREGGTAVLFAHAPEQRSRADFDLNELFKHEKRVIGTYSGTLREQREIFEAIATGRLDASPLITHRLPMERFEEAVELARERRALKVVLTP